MKHALTSTAKTVAASASTCQGAGTIDINAASKVKKSDGAEQTFAPSTGAGTLEGARGNDDLTAEGVTLRGEQDIMDSTWTPWCSTTSDNAAGAGSCDTTRWDGGTWNGGSWSGDAWLSRSWSGSA